MPSDNPFTDMGDGPRHFPPTSLGMVEGIRDPSHPNHKAAVEGLCQRYWRPVYHFIRPWWTRSNEDAKDLTQSFLLSVIETGALTGFDSKKGSFRNFMKVLLRRWLAKDARAGSRQKRGGDRHIVSLENDPALTPRSDDADPDAAFDRALMQQLVDAALEELRARYTARGRGHIIDIFEAYDLSDADPKPTYADLASRHGIKPSDVRNALYTIREAVRQHMLTQLAHMTPDVQSLEDEWQDLIG